MIDEKASPHGDGSVRIWLLSAIAKLLGVQFHIDGLPFGARRVVEPGVSGSTAP